jgi:hypothetical protein
VQVEESQKYVCPNFDKRVYEKRARAIYLTRAFP